MCHAWHMRQVMIITDLQKAGPLPTLLTPHYVPRPALGQTQHSMQGVPGALSLGIKRPGREADHSPPTSAEVEEWVEYTSIHQYAFMAWC
jgi:hypothetical protein